MIVAALTLTVLYFFGDLLVRTYRGEPWLALLDLALVFWATSYLLVKTT